MMLYVRLYGMHYSHLVSIIPFGMKIFPGHLPRTSIDYPDRMFLKSTLLNSNELRQALFMPHGPVFSDIKIYGLRKSQILDFLSVFFNFLNILKIYPAQFNKQINEIRTSIKATSIQAVVRYCKKPLRYFSGSRVNQDSFLQRDSLPIPVAYHPTIISWL